MTPEEMIKLSDEQLQQHADEIRNRIDLRIQNIALKEHLWELVRAVGRLLDDKYSEGDAAVRQELWTAMHRTGDEAREYLQYITQTQKQ